MTFPVQRPLPEKLQQFRGILFLDFDGVINTVDWCTQRALRLISGEYMTEFAPQTVGPLNRILTTCDLGIVVSSSWRLSVRNDLPAILEQNGVDRGRERYLASTPDFSRMREDEVPFGNERGGEIRAWLAATGYGGPFAVLDDASDLEAVAAHHFKTDVWLGLTEEIADAVIAHFGQ